jgi:hypothetical protein
MVVGPPPELLELLELLGLLGALLLLPKQILQLFDSRLSEGGLFVG